MKLELDFEKRSATRHCASCDSALADSTVCVRLLLTGELIFLCRQCLARAIKSIDHHLEEARVGGV